MTNSYFMQQLLIGLLVLGGALGGCQRASYSFQPPALAETAAPVALALASTVIPIPPAPAAPETEAVRKRQIRRPDVRKPIAGLAKRGTVAAGRQRLQTARQYVPSRRLALPPRQALAPEPTPTTPNKWLAVALAVLFGVFGAHLFYLGNRRGAIGYLAATLLCVGLIALLLATLPASSMGAGFAILFVVCMAAVGIGLVYVRALVDAVRIIIEGPDAVS